MMKFFVLSLGFLISLSGFGQQMDTVFSDMPFFVEYAIDSNTIVRQTRNVKFYSEAVDDLLLKEVDFSIDTVDGREEYFNRLTVTAYEAKSNYKTERWRIQAINEKPHKLYYGEYYVSVIYGCCEAEDEFQLYSLKNGKKAASVTYFEMCFRPFTGMITYLSPNAANDRTSWPKGVIGQLDLHYDKTDKSPAKILRINIASLSVQDFPEFTPEIKVLEKEELMKTKDAFYARIEKVKAKHFVVLDYYGEYKIMIPFDNDIPLLSSTIVSNPGLRVSYKK